MKRRKSLPSTALTRYALLQSMGLWREAKDTQRREVVVTFKEATLILRNPQNDRVLTHWSLPAIRRLDNQTGAALFSPDAQGDETLELDDKDMIVALDEIQKAVNSPYLRHKRVRRWGVLAGTGAIVLLGLLLLPEALIRQTSSVLPPESREIISRTILSDMRRLTGSTCQNPSAVLVLKQFERALLGQDSSGILVVRSGVPKTTHLPDGTIVVNQSVLVDNDDPKILADLILSEYLRAQSQDALLPALRYAGFWNTLKLLTTGALPHEALAGYGEVLLRAAPPENTALEQKIAVLVEAHPPEGALSLDDTAWVSLQNICF